MPARSPRPRVSRSLGAAKPALERLYTQFDHADSAEDPVHLVRRYRDDADREIAGFCAAALAFGRVTSVLASIEALLAVMGSSPAGFVRNFDAARDRPALAPLRHRWTTGDDLVELIRVLNRIVRTDGSLEQFFLHGYDDQADDIGGALDSFCTRALAFSRRRRPRGVGYFFPRPSGGSACKRLNLYLRWMVRRDHIDFGLWRRVSTAKLVIPLDTHVIRVSQCLGLTTYRSPGWPMARQITAMLRRIDPEDPIRYDFSLCHIGMQDACGFSRPQRDERCPLRGVCRPGARKPAASRRPSAPR